TRSHRTRNRRIFPVRAGRAIAQSGHSLADTWLDSAVPAEHLLLFVGAATPNATPRTQGLSATRGSKLGIASSPAILHVQRTRAVLKHSYEVHGHWRRSGEYADRTNPGHTRFGLEFDRDARCGSSRFSQSEFSRYSRCCL